MSDFGGSDFALGMAQLAGQTTAAALSYGTHKADRKFNAEQARLNREWQEKMWNLANEYNHPIQVMQRLREAGLNPALAYGDGASTLAAQVGHGGQAQAPADRIQYPDISMAMMIGKQLQESQSRIDLNESKELLNREEARLAKFQSGAKELENMWNRDSYQLRLDALEAENNLKVSLASTEVSKRNEIESTIRLQEKNADFLEFDMWNKERLTTKEMQEIDNRIYNANRLTAKTIEKLNAEEKKAYAEAWLARAQASLQDDPRYKDAKVELAVNEAYKAMMEGNIKSVEYRLEVLKEELMPKPGESAWKFQKFCENWIGSFTRPVGYLLGGNVGVTKTIK